MTGPSGHLAQLARSGKQLPAESLAVILQSVEQSLMPGTHPGDLARDTRGHCHSTFLCQGFGHEQITPVHLNIKLREEARRTGVQRHITRQVRDALGLLASEIVEESVLH